MQATDGLVLDRFDLVVQVPAPLVLLASTGMGYDNPCTGMG